MNIRFRLMCVAVLGTLCAYTGTAYSQIITITDAQYKAIPQTAEPQGTYTYPGTGKAYRPFVDYGYIDKGVYTPDGTVSKGGPGQPEVITKVGGGANGNWSSKDTHTLTNPKVGLYARARIQQYNPTTMGWDEVTGTATYELVGVPVPPGGCEEESEEPREPREPAPAAAILEWRRDAVHPPEGVA